MSHIAYADSYGIVFANGKRFPHRTPRAYGPWLNWHINRGRIHHATFTARDLRMVSHRRTF